MVDKIFSDKTTELGCYLLKDGDCNIIIGNLYSGANDFKVIKLSKSDIDTLINELKVIKSQMP